MKLIIEPADGVAPLLAAIKGAKKSIEIAVFRFDRKDIETALKAAAARGVKVTALIAFANRGGEQGLRKLELRCLAAGIIIARTSDDLIRYHGKYILIDRRVLYVLSFNFTHLDIDHSRGFGIVTTHAHWVREAARLFRADCTRTKYAPKTDTFVVSPANSRKVLDTFLRRAKTQLLIYDPKISDKAMLRLLQERAKAGVEIRDHRIGGRAQPSSTSTSWPGSGCTRARLSATGARRSSAARAFARRNWTSRRELGLIVQDAKAVKALVDTFESDWACHRQARRRRRLQ